MSLATNFVLDWPVFANVSEFAQSVTYTQAGADTTVTVVFERPDTERPDEQPGTRGDLWSFGEGDVYIGKDPTHATVPGITLPTRDDSLTIEGERWQVVGPPMDRRGWWQLRIRLVTLEETGPSRHRVIGP